MTILLVSGLKLKWILLTLNNYIWHIPGYNLLIQTHVCVLLMFCTLNNAYLLNELFINRDHSCCHKSKTDIIKHTNQNCFCNLLNSFKNTACLKFQMFLEISYTMLL